MNLIQNSFIAWTEYFIFLFLFDKLSELHGPWGYAFDAIFIFWGLMGLWILIDGFAKRHNF